MVSVYFTPGAGATGGAIIGFSAAALLLLSGEILGASGIASSFLLEPRKAVSDPSVAWKFAFLAVFMLLANTSLGASFTNDERWGSDPSIPVPSIWGYLIGGAFVGFGTKLGNGCTTGHGICGMARLSKRSILAVCTFMATAFATSAMLSPENEALSNGTAFLRTEDGAPELFNRWLGFAVSMILVVLPALFAIRKAFKGGAGDDDREELGRHTDKTESFSVVVDESTQLGAVSPTNNYETGPSGTGTSATTPHGATTMLSVGSTKVVLVAGENDAENFRKVIVGMLAGMLFALGLAIGEMVMPSKVLGFLALHTIPMGTYDPTLLLVMVGGVIISFISYQFVEGWGVVPNRFALQCPVAARKFSVPTNTTLDAQLFGGALCFGIGWATVGLCPGPAIFLAATGTKPVIFFWWPAFIVGSYIASKLKQMLST